MQTVPESSYLETKPRQWPTVIGILAIVWGGFNLISSVWSLVAILVGRTAPGMTTGPVDIALSALGMLLAGVLVAGGIQLLRRRPSGVQLVQTWIPLALVLSLVGVGMLVKNRDAFEVAVREAIQAQAEEASKRSGKPAPEMPKEMATAMWGSSVACGGVFALVPLVPAFFVFGRRGREAVAEWSAAPADPWRTSGTQA